MVPWHRKGSEHYVHPPQSDGTDMLTTLQRTRQAGPWYGLICCCVLALGWLVWQVLDWWDPPGSVPRAPRFPVRIIQGADKEASADPCDVIRASRSA